MDYFVLDIQFQSMAEQILIAVQKFADFVLPISGIVALISFHRNSHTSSARIAEGVRLEEDRVTKTWHRELGILLLFLIL